MWDNSKWMQIYRNWGEITPSNAPYDRSLFWLYLLFLMIGIIAISSAGVVRAEPMKMALTQIYYVLLSLVVFFMVCYIPTRYIEKASTIIPVIAIILLIITIVFGEDIKGAKRWIKIFGISFQSAEFAKLAMICYLASFFMRREKVITYKTFGGFYPILVLGLFFVILYKGQSDLGSAVVIAAISMGMLWVSGAKKLQFLIYLLILVLLIFIAIYFSDDALYRIGRMDSFFKGPFSDSRGDTYQLDNALIAMGQGGFFGMGLGNGIYKLGFVPESVTDFVVAVVGEEFGWLGIVTIILLFMLLTLRIFKISKEALKLEERYKGFLAFGIGLLIFGQSLANLGVASGMLPTKGLTFPFVSYGGSSLLIMSISVALVLRIDYENRQMKGKI